MATSKNQHMILRFALVYIAIVMAFGLIVSRIWHIQHSERERWLELSDSLRKINKEYTIEPIRGNIYSDDNRLLASSVPVYYLYIDFRTPGLRDKDGKIFFDNLDSLSICLANKFRDRSASDYKAYLKKAYKEKNASCPLYSKKISHADYNEIKRFPLFNLGTRSGLINKMQIKRVKPYGSLAAVTVGDLFGEKSKGAKYGIEASYDEYLKGEPGKAHMERRAGVNILTPDQPAENGSDVISTINIDMQDAAEKALREKLFQIDADWGCAVVMEVETGQVKAIVNLKRNAPGDYREMESIVLRTHLEPGSTFKIPAMMAALEEGLDTTEVIDCGNGIWKFNEKTTITDHNANKGGNGVIPIAQTIVRSSNIGLAKIIYKTYKDNPQSYIDRLKRMGVGMPMDVGMKGALQASIRGPKENPKWASSDLVSMAYGYTVDMPILYTLTFYNAIANNGKMMQPYFVKEIRKSGMTEKTFEPVVLKSSICSARTLNITRDMMRQVIEDPEHATGKPVRSKYVRIAGKTGTARFGYKDGSIQHQVSFCGFYPYENPKYSTIVFIRNPRVGIPSGGGMAGSVFKEIAERVMALHSFLSVEKYPEDSLRSINPTICSGNKTAGEIVLKNLKQPYNKVKNVAEWGVHKKDSNNVLQFIPYENKENAVPSVIGMGLKDAIYLLESNGLKVKATGRGKVKTQSLQAGTALRKGLVIELVLQ